MEENLRLSGGSAHRAGHQVLYLPVEVVVRLEPDCIEDALALQVLVDVRYREGRVPSQVELLVHLLVLVHYGGEKLPPAVCGVDVAGPQYRSFAVAIVVEAEQRVIAGGAEVAVIGRALLAAMDLS